MAGWHKMPRSLSQVVRSLARNAAGLLGVLIGFLALLENVVPPTTDLAKDVWLISFATLSLFLAMVVVIQGFHEISRIDAQEERRQVRERAEDDSRLAIQTMAARLELLDPHLGLAATAFKLADDLTLFLQNLGIPRRVHLTALLQLLAL
jgi:hypothetical protein